MKWRRTPISGLLFVQSSQFSTWLCSVIDISKAQHSYLWSPKRAWRGCKHRLKEWDMIPHKHSTYVTFKDRHARNYKNPARTRMLSTSNVDQDIVLGPSADGLFFPWICQFSDTHADALLIDRWKNHGGAGVICCFLVCVFVSLAKLGHSD